MHLQIDGENIFVALCAVEKSDNLFPAHGDVLKCLQNPKMFNLPSCTTELQILTFKKLQPAIFLHLCLQGNN